MSMAILIKGVEMPKSCFNCKFPRACQAITRRIDEMDRAEWFPKDHRHSDCPLIEVHEPHGRLISEDDIDAAVNAIKNALLELKTARTVIPASEEAE